MWKEIMVAMLVSFLGKSEENNLFNVDVENGAGRPCAVDNRFAIVITDGKTVGGTVPKAQSLKNANVKILAVGVGDGVDISLLQAIASGNQNVFLVEDFDTFPSILDGLISSICTQDSASHGFCGFPCTLHNKTYDLCPCDEDNVNQTYSVGGNDTTVFTENFGGENKTDWECYTRSERFYVVRCMNIVKLRYMECGIIILESGFCGCALPTICPVTNNVTQTQCDACESSEGNDDGLCCS